MLEVRNLTKIYQPKKGVAVRAVDGISLKFPQKGMVFLLGKSGSGKSTLLNLLGGLDRADEGEIYVKGVCAKDFSQAYFDSYRNTYVGFIFQEYNVLEDFTVGANIALAIELQGRRAENEEINRILQQVDLEGLGSRKPSELSGGQKQRVAIARALVKNPEIIMADEPSGALDSATGKQVFETLKRLSADKLVIVVSHDRDFAERYADRIIELADGKVIRDVERTGGAAEKSALEFTNDGVNVAAGYELTEDDRRAINDYLRSRADGTFVIRPQKTADSAFSPTDESRISSDYGAFRLIKSKLPMKSAFKIGASGLKHKKFRLVMTILLSCVAFGLFGLSDTFGAYNHLNTCTQSIRDTEIPYVSVRKTTKVQSGDLVYWQSYNNMLSEADLADFTEKTQVPLVGVKAPRSESLGFWDNVDVEALNADGGWNIYTSTFTGMAEIDEAALKNVGATLTAGRLPDGTKDEIAISRYVCESFFKGGYSEDGTTFVPVANAEEMIGKTLTIGEKVYTVVGVVDTGLDFDRYRSLSEPKEYTSRAEQLVEYALSSEFSYACNYSMAAVMMTGRGFFDRQPAVVGSEQTYGDMYASYYGIGDNLYVDFNARRVARLSEIDPSKVTWLDGEKTTLAPGEFIACIDDESLNFGFDNGNNSRYFKDDQPDYTAMFKALTTLRTVCNDAEAKVVGYTSAYPRTVIVDDAMYDQCAADAPGGVYSFAVGRMPDTAAGVRKVVETCYDETGDTRPELCNAVTFELDTVHEILKLFSRVFLYVGIGFAVFAALMLANFIGTSIAYKKQEIGILRAIGSRSNDVFRIFFSESFLIAMINFVLSAAGTCAVTAFINYVIRNHYGILVTVLNFGVRQCLLLFAVSLLVALIASFFPVKKIASKRPIDAIRNR